MAVYRDTMHSMIGRVRMMRPDISAEHVKAFLNDRIRQALDHRTYWSDLLVRGVLSIPDQYATGTITTTENSAVVTGVGTAWPINDRVNTTLFTAIDEIGYVDIIPASMTGITADSLLVIDTGGSAETLAVISTEATQFRARVTKVHSAGVAITASSLAGRQFRVNSGTPIFTVNHVTSATSLTLDMPWRGPGVTGSAYYIIGMYYTIAPDMKDILLMVDHQYGRPMKLHVSALEMNWRDPQRSASGPPWALVDLGPNACGNYQFEVWPSQFTARQCPYIYMRQWPELVNDNDVPPWFINPTVFIDGAIADALRYKTGPKDALWNPDLAEVYERRHLAGLEDAKNNDASKMQRDYDFNYQQVYGAYGANFWQTHDPDLWNWNL